MNQLQQQSERALASTSEGITRIQTLGAIFVVVFTVMLVSNIYLSESVKEDASDINLAGRQRMLSQRLTKSTINMLSSLNQGEIEDARTAQAEALLSYNLFNDTLTAFLESGDTQGASGDSVFIKAVTQTDIKKHAEDALVIWEEITQDLNYITTDDVTKINTERLNHVVSYLSENNLTLLKLMNSLTVGLDDTSQNTSSRQQLILWVALALVFGIFTYIFVYALKGLKKRDSELAAYANRLSSNYSSLRKTYSALENTQTELNTSNQSLQQALDTVRESSELAQARADELEDITLDLNRLKEEADTIFGAVDHGLCLLDEKANIGQRVSSTTYDIFETEKLAGRSFVDLMRPLITEKDLNTLASFIKLQFNKKSLKSQLDKFNPLKKIEITLNWDGNKFKSKHLGFDFERIMDKGEVAAVLVTITDVTETVALEQELKRASEDQERKTALILEIIQSDVNELDLFLSKTDKTLNSINQSLQDNGINHESADSNKEVLEEVFRNIHNIKGNASMLGLKTIVNIAHEVENNLTELREKPQIKGEEFLSSLMQLATLRELLDDYEEITHSILKDFASNSKPTKNDAVAPTTQSEKLAHDISTYTSQLAEKNDKKVFTRCSFEMNDISETGISEMKDIIIQLARNTVVHGIESPKKRVSLGKLEEGNFTAICELDNSSDNVIGKPAYKFTFQDDGAGLDIEKLRARAIALKIKTPTEAKALNDAQVASLIFEPAFSTKENSNEDAGRGMGMDIIREKIVNTLGGKLSMNFAPGYYMKISCHIPAETLHSEILT